MSCVQKPCLAPVHIAGSSVIVASPAASSGQPLVLAVLEVINPDLALACQVEEEQHMGRAGVVSLMFVESWPWNTLNVDAVVSAVASFLCTVNAIQLTYYPFSSDV